MPYDKMNPSSEGMSEEHKDIHEHLDMICTYLWQGEAWHERAANECRKMHIRGLGRWHEAEAKYDGKSRICLEKILQDKLQYAATIDIMPISNALTYSMSNASDLKTHFHMWIDREHTLIKELDHAIHKAAKVDMELYKELCGLVNEVQNEAMRAQMVYDRFEFAGWNGHDIGVCSMVLHKYFEHEYDGGTINFNLG